MKQIYHALTFTMLIGLTHIESQAAEKSDATVKSECLLLLRDVADAHLSGRHYGLSGADAYKHPVPKAVQSKLEASGFRIGMYLEHYGRSAFDPAGTNQHFYLRFEGDFQIDKAKELIRSGELFQLLNQQVRINSISIFIGDALLTIRPANQPGGGTGFGEGPNAEYVVSLYSNRSHETKIDLSSAGRNADHRIWGKWKRIHSKPSNHTELLIALIDSLNPKYDVSTGDLVEQLARTEGHLSRPYLAARKERMDQMNAGQK